MMTAAPATFPTRERSAQGHLLFGAILPFFVVAESVSRAFAHGDGDDAPRPAARGSVFAVGRVNASIATSYLLMARAMLH